MRNAWITPPHAMPAEIPKPGETSEPTDPTAPGCTCEDPCHDCAGKETHAPGCDNSTFPSSSYSDHPVRYSNGEVYMVTEDLSFKSFGVDWGHTRSYSNRVTEPNTGRNGNSWFVKEWPYLSPSNLNANDPNMPGTICLVWIVQESLWFDISSVGGGTLRGSTSGPN